MPRIGEVKMYPIVEIFDSIQGEGMFIGCPATFIRLAGCSLQCTWCDTDHSQFTQMDVLSIVEKIGNPFVVITGGEPGIHDLQVLLEAIHKARKDSFVAIETNGIHAIKGRYPSLVQWVTCSPKPQSHYDIHPQCIPDELKYVVDEEFHVGKIPLHYMDPNREQWKIPIWLQPQGFDMANSVKKAYRLVTLDDKVGRLRLGVQLHKIFDFK